MGVANQHRPLRVAPGRTPARRAVCLLLGALLLYNPFFTILSISQDLSVQHSLSYRTTLAGSELRRCTFEASKPLIPGLSAAVFLAAILSWSDHQVSLVAPHETVVSATQPLCDNIWFRPPPSV